MTVATAFYVASDTMMKLASIDLPPYEILVLRGISATFWATSLILALGLRSHVR